MTPRRELALAVLLSLAGALLAWYAVTRTWVELAVVGGLTIDELSSPYAGTMHAGFALALALVVLAGVLALAATRRSGRTVVGVLMTAAGAVVVVRMALFLGDFSRHAARCPGDCAPTTVVAAHPLWGWLTLLGGLLMTVGGLLVALRGRGWPSLGSSYDRVTTTPDGTPVTDKAVWDALDEGHDPTA